MLSHKGRLLLPAGAVCSAPWPTGKGLTGESGTRIYFLSRCEVPVAAAFSACHVCDRQGCSCPLDFAAQRSPRQLECSLGIRPLPEGAAQFRGHLWKVEVYCSACGGKYSRKVCGWVVSWLQISTIWCSCKCRGNP